MEYTASYSPLAEFDLAEAYFWYRDRSPSVAAKFQAQAGAALRELCEAPLRWAIWRRPEYRRYCLPGFPYVFGYRVEDRHITIVSILHQQQDASRRFPEDP